MQDTPKHPAKPAAPDGEIRPPRRDTDTLRQSDDPAIAGDEKHGGYQNTDESAAGAKDLEPVEPQRVRDDADLLH